MRSVTILCYLLCLLVTGLAGVAAITSWAEGDWRTAVTHGFGCVVFFVLSVLCLILLWEHK